MFNKLNIIKVFFEEPTREFNVREIARIVKVSPATASSKLKKFVKEGLLKERKERILKMYKADLESSYYRDLKIFYNIRKIRSSGLLEALDRFYLRPAVVLFGSSASGTDTETSDIDLMIISEKDKHFADLKNFEKKLKRQVQIFAVKSIKDLKNKYLINNVLNGIVIQGKVKWI